MSPAPSKCSRADVIIILSFLLSLTLEEMSGGEDEAEEKEKIFPAKADTDSILLARVFFLVRRMEDACVRARATKRRKNNNCQSSDER